MTKQFRDLKGQNADLVKQARQMGLVSKASQEDGEYKMNSQLALDLKEQGIQCIEKVPQIADVRQAQ